MTSLVGTLAAVLLAFLLGWQGHAYFIDWRAASAYKRQLEAYERQEEAYDRAWAEEFREDPEEIQEHSNGWPS